MTAANIVGARREAAQKFIEKCAEFCSKSIFPCESGEFDPKSTEWTIGWADKERSRLLPFEFYDVDIDPRDPLLLQADGHQQFIPAAKLMATIRADYEEQKITDPLDYLEQLWKKDPVAMRLIASLDEVITIRKKAMADHRLPADSDIRPVVEQWREPFLKYIEHFRNSGMKELLSKAIPAIEIKTDTKALRQEAASIFIKACVEFCESDGVDIRWQIPEKRAMIRLPVYYDAQIQPSSILIEGDNSKEFIEAAKLLATLRADQEEGKITDPLVYIKKLFDDKPTALQDVFRLNELLRARGAQFREEGGEDHAKGVELLAAQFEQIGTATFLRTALPEIDPAARIARTESEGRAP